MRYYELTYLISPKLSEEEINRFQEKIKSLIQEEKGILGEVNGPTKKRMAYPVGKNDQAYLVTLNFQLNSENLADLEKKLKAEGQILRYMLLTKKVPKIGVPEKVRVPTKKIAKPKPKVELKEIEKKLEEILGET